jgi:hypothetical protein
MNFSFRSYRSLCRYLGETDALVELTELACRSFQDAAERSGNESAFITAESERIGIRVNLSEVEPLMRHLAQNYIVTVYQSAECFLHEFRKEHRALYKRDWVGVADDVDPLTVTLKNLSVNSPENVIGRDLISRFQYYRIVRNWVVHTKESDISKPLAKFNDIVQYSVERNQLRRLLPEPNRPDALNFNDFICFSRVTKLIAEKICSLAKPPENHWSASFPMDRFKRLMKKPDRMKNSIAGYLRTEYGMDAKTAQCIAKELMAH